MKCVTYLSPQTQNELLDVIGNHIILGDLVQEIKTAQFYSIMADEVTSHNTEQLALCVRFVDSDENIREEFIQFSKVIRTTGEYLANEIIHILENLGIPLKDMRGQGYDGASNMSSGRVGVQAKIREHAPLATYVHCSGHCLNLVISHACNIPEVRNMIDKLKNCCLFFRNSPKRNELLELITAIKVENQTRRKTLIDLCRTRWAERQNAYQHFYQCYFFIVDALQVIGYKMHLEEYNGLHEGFAELYWDWKTQTRSDAQKLLTGITSFGFIIVFLTVYQYLSHLSGLTVQLQSSSLDIIHAYNAVNDIKDIYKKERHDVDSNFESVIFKQAERMAAKVGVEPNKPRVSGRQIYRANNAASSTVLEHYKLNLAIPFLDHVCENLNSKFSGLAKTAISLLGLVPSILCENNMSIDEILRMYNEDLPSPEVTDLELKRWKMRYENVSPERRPSTPAAALKDCDGTHFPNIKTLLRIACTIPATSCECERSASSLRRLHSYARATMGQERLSALALLHIHYDKEIDLDRVVNVFVQCHPRRLELSSIIKP
ncbi:52 kDa repressor of the inhibitor of the protein kinase-like [Gigantopelta aegis]|uniref:52 kDa repressor of the inhibitor of the protein kinase-like n=1 Tax=Gigantopelta aegis TaxID=1735272 RepID=UPI001B8887C6|nr:52 kDa repressor of the inhibitor of the protein kinase-like [Gigantopelta aegis]